MPDESNFKLLRKNTLGPFTPPAPISQGLDAASILKSLIRGPGSIVSPFNAGGVMTKQIPVARNDMYNVTPSSQLSPLPSPIVPNINDIKYQLAVKNQQKDQKSVDHFTEILKNLLNK